MLLLIFLSYALPYDSPIMKSIEYLQIRGFLEVSPIKPYDHHEILSQINELVLAEIEFNSIDKKIISSFNPLLIKQADFSLLFHLHAQYQQRPSRLVSFGDPRLGAKISNNIYCQQGIRFRFGSDLDSLGPKSWKDIAQAYLCEGAIQLNTDQLKFILGRRNLFLGPGDEHSLLFSLDPQGYDGYLISFPARYSEFSSTFSILNTRPLRCIATHRLGLNLKTFKLGFSEAILWAYELEPLYLNFLLPYYTSQWGMDRDDNIMWSFDASLNLFQSLIYAEFLIDDFQYEKVGPIEYPHKLAYQWGIKSLLLTNLLVKFNYTFVDRWVYTQRDSINTYERNGRCLGFPLGNDIDRLSLEARFLTPYSINPGLRLTWTRKGENNNLFIPYEQEPGEPNPPFPSGVVEKKLETKLGLDYTFKYNLHIEASMSKRFWFNFANVEGDNRNEVLVDAGCWLIF